MRQKEAAPDMTAELSEEELEKETIELHHALRERLIPNATEIKLRDLIVTFRSEGGYTGRILFVTDTIEQFHGINFDSWKSGNEFVSIKVKTDIDTHPPVSNEPRQGISYEDLHSGTKSKNTQLAVSKAWEILDDLLPPKQS